MANQKIFCAVPWTNHHFYWDGTYGVCSSERQRPRQQSNLNNTSLVQWYDSESMRDFRRRIQGNEQLPECASCYQEEADGHQSRRIKENYKLGIFTEHTENTFQQSFVQSEWHAKFNTEGTTDLLPVDWHIDLGNECNFACKMCIPEASSKIASAYNLWNIEYNKKPNWVNNDASWQQLLENLTIVKQRLNRVHIIGGEPLVNKKFYQLIDWLLENNFNHISVSVVTNGTNVTQEIVNKLKQFRLVHFEISAESVGKTNDYIRQGCEYNKLWETIDFLSKQQSDNFQLVLRSAPQLLSVNDYYEYILKAYELRLAITSVPLTYPKHMAINILPWDIRQSLKQHYEKTLSTIEDNNETKLQTIAIGRDTSRLAQLLARECRAIITMLDSPTPDDADGLRYKLVEWMQRWDTKYNFNAIEFYPEYEQFFRHYGYTI